jgi:Na+-translocating ferredoxin:NAD+ oxidoreductase RnfC subunit
MTAKAGMSHVGPTGAGSHRPSADRLEELGIVGAGGGGFPTAVKYRAKVSLVIANAAECEPLLHKDKELLLHNTALFLRGLQMAMAITGASEGAVGIKEKYQDIIELLEQQAPKGVRVVPLPDVYPAGDEFILVNMVTGRVIPPGGLPKDVDVMVSNVETLLNIALDKPVTHKYLSVAGAVKNPVTLRVPLGISIREVIEAAGGATVSDFAVLLGGVMMARPAASLDVPVTKTTGGIVVLPASHPLILKHNTSWLHVQRRGRSACDQCRTCTEMCPRYLLGHPIEPHMAMRSLGFASSADTMIAGTLYCCGCNLCTMYSCPEGLDPRTVCTQAKPAARERGLVFKGTPESITPHPLAEFRRVPMHRLITKLGLSEFNNVGPLIEHSFSPRIVNVLLRQHAGAPAVPVVKTGDRVHVGDLLAMPQQGKLGARVHASIDGVVKVTNEAVVIEA